MKKLGTVIFRADGGAAMGLGHIVRSLALAQMLRKRFRIFFVMRPVAASIERQIMEVADETIILEGSQDFEQEAHQLVAQYLRGNEIVVLDGYSFGTEYQRAIRERGCCVVCIDDIHDCHFIADAIINHAGGVQRHDYSCEAYTQMLLGPAYALLRPAFLQRPDEQRTIPELMTLPFVCFGGADPANMTLKVGKRLLGFPQIRNIKMVVGAANRFSEEIKAWAAKEEKVELFFDLSAEAIADVMKACDFAVAPASSIAYEICALGIPLWVGKYVDNQEFLYDYLVDNGLALGLDDFESDIFWSEIPKGKDFFAVVKKQKEVFDGRSGERLVNFFVSQLLRIRRAETDDAPLYFQWANEEEVRKNSLNTNPIEWEEHLRWFVNRVALKDAHVFYVFEVEGTPVGQVRFDILREKVVINYSLDKHYRGSGLATPLLKKAIEALQHEHCTLPEITGVVKKENVASQIVFDKLGFRAFREDANIIEYKLT